MKKNEKRPAVIFLNAVGDQNGDKPKDWAVYKTWAQLIAASGFIGVTMEADGENILQNLKSLFSFIEQEGDKFGIDSKRLGVYSASANVEQSTKFLLNENAPKGIKAAVLYYGGVPDGELRKDLPVMFVIAESDMPRMENSIPELWKRITESGAPWTVTFASRQPHAFDSFSNTAEARRLIQQTIAFWKTNLETPTEPSLQFAEEREIMTAIYSNDTQQVVKLLKPYLEKHPSDAIALGHYGTALQELKQLDEALMVFQRAQKITPQDPEIYGALGRLFFAKRIYREAVINFGKAIQGGLTGPGMYSQLANAYMADNQPQEAINSYEKALEKGIARRGAYYNIACAYIRLKQTDKAFEFLNKAIDEGFKDRKTFENDSDLDPIREDVRFQKLLLRF